VRDTDSDVIVLGGGPCGSAAARLLALWGHHVKQFAPAPDGARTLGESIPPSCSKLFDVLGVRQAVEQAGFIRSTGNTVWWGDANARVETFAAGHGWQVTRDALARLLLDASRSAGVDIREERLPVESATDLGPLLVDCTGRAGLVARSRGWRVYEPGHRTLALVAEWRSSAWDVPDPSHTLIESYADGWVWSVPVTEETRHVAVMVDPRTSNLTKSRGGRAAYLAELAKTTQFRQLLAPATLLEDPRGWDASMYSSSRFADDRLIVAGDAASFIDPLSSAGIKKALASGWLAAVAVHTAIVNPAMHRAAFDFFAAREAEIYASFKHMTERHLVDAAKGQEHPFWTDRAMTFQPNAVDDHTDVAGTFEQIRRAPSLELRVSDTVRIEPRAAVSGCEIVMETRLVAPDAPAGVRFVRDVDLVALLPLLAASDQVPDLFDAYHRQAAPVDLADFLAALATAIARGWVVRV
jgi:flavin-dependent dehydrogenase